MCFFMIKRENADCGYCLEPLTTKDEIELQYHISCRNQFERFNPEFTDFPLFNLEELERYKKLNSKRHIISFIALISAMSSFVLLFINFLPLIASSYFNTFLYFFGHILLFIIIVFFMNRFENLDKFCKALIYLKPDYMHLSFKYSVAIIGEIYVVNYPILVFSNGIYIIKFLDIFENKASRKVKLPKFPFSTAFINEHYEIKFARMAKNIQIRLSTTTVKFGLASIYCAGYNNIKSHYENLNSLIFFMKSENLYFQPEFSKYSMWKILGLLSVPIIIALLRSIFKYVILAN